MEIPDEFWVALLAKVVPENLNIESNLALKRVLQFDVVTIGTALALF